MSHHSGNNFYDKDTHDFFKNLKLGATGRFPDGKLDANDEGELRIGVTVKDEKVVLAFGKPVEWIGFTREQAIQLGQNLIDRARQID